MLFNSVLISGLLWCIVFFSTFLHMQVLGAGYVCVCVFVFSNQTELADLLRPISEQIEQIQTFREKNRGSRLFNHLSAVSESIPALGWVAVVSQCVPYAVRVMFSEHLSYSVKQNPCDFYTQLC